MMKKPWYWVLGALALVAAIAVGYSLGTGSNDSEPPAPSPSTVSTAAPVAVEPSDTEGAFTYGPGATISSSSDITAVHRLREDDPFAVGAIDAPVVISAFSDFECPFCAKFAVETYPQILRDYVEKGLVRVEWNDMAINGPHSHEAAEAARAAAAQGTYHEFSEILFAEAAKAGGHPGFSTDDFTRFAREAGVADMDTFSKELSDGTYRDVVDKATRYAASIGVNGTPSFFIGDKFLSGAQPYDVFKQVIDAQLAQ